MATETEELRLVVNLTDNASAGLAKLRQELSQIGGGASGQSLQRIQQDTAKLGEHFKGLGTEATRAGQAVARLLTGSSGLGAIRQELGHLATASLSAGRALSGGFGFGIGLASGGLAILGVELAKQIYQLPQWTAEIRKAAIAAQSIGVNAAQMDDVVKQLEKQGISAEAATQSIAGITAAIADLSKAGSQLRPELIGMTGFGNQRATAAMRDFIDQLMKAQTVAERTNLVLKASEDVRLNALKEGKSEILATANANAFAAKLGVDRTLMQAQAIRELSAGQQKQRDQLIRDASNVANIIGNIGFNAARIGDALGSLLIDPNSPIVIGLKLIDWTIWSISQGVKFLRWLGDPFREWSNPFSGKADAGRPGQHPNAAGTHPPAMNYGGTGFGATPPAANVPVPGAAAPGAGTHPPAGRTDYFGGAGIYPGLAQQTSSVTTGGATYTVGDPSRLMLDNTAQLRRLNDNLELIIRPGAGGAATGGGVLGALGGGAAGTGAAGDGTGGGGAPAGYGTAPPGTGPGGSSRADGGSRGAGVPEAGTGPGPGGTPPMGEKAAEGAGLAATRANQAKELADPAVRAKLAAYAHAEVGGQGPQAVQAFMETTLNRAAARGKSISETLSGSYFPPTTHSKAARGAPESVRAEYDKTIDKVTGGSNISNYATGNASGTVQFGKGGYQTYGGKETGGEKFGVEAQDRTWVDKMRASRQTQTASTDPKGGIPESNSIPSRFSDDLKAMTLNGAQPHNIHAYMMQHGINLSEATCGAFMASVVKEHGGTPPKSPETASQWNTFGGKEGAGYSSDPNAINVAVKQGTRTGLQGSHVTGAVPILDKDGKVVGFRGVGVNQYNPPGKEHGVGPYGRDVISSKPLSIGTGPGQYQIRHQIVNPSDSQVAAAKPDQKYTGPGDTVSHYGGKDRQPIAAANGNDQSEIRAAREAAAATPQVFSGTQEQYEAYQASRGGKGALLPPDADRRQLDRAQAATHKVEGTGKITVDVNAPKGTNVGVEGGGLFRKTEVNRQTQMERAKSGPTSETIAA